MKRLICLPLLAALFFLTGCSDIEEFLRPQPERQRLPATALDYHPGESAIWCYRTLADADCFSGPQGGPPNRLIERYTDRTGRYRNGVWTRQQGAAQPPAALVDGTVGLAEEQAE